jgi:transposase
MSSKPIPCDIASPTGMSVALEQLQRDNASLREQLSELRRQLEWFQKQLFGQKSERRIVLGPDQAQLNLDQPVQTGTPPQVRPTRIAEHTRAAPTPQDQDQDESSLFFDPSKVPVQEIVLPDPQTEGLAPDQFEVISQKVTHHLAQRPGSYVILKYVRPVVKIKTTQSLSCPSAPQSVIAGSRADVSFVAGMIVDKLVYHLPLYRQHQRLERSAITVSRPWLTQLTHACARLLAPIAQAQLASIRGSRVVAIDETPIKAGRAGPGKMHTGYFWPVYGEQDELSFLYFPTRGHRHVFEILGHSPPQGAVLLSDGYEAYRQYALKTQLTHAQCWAHLRRHLIDSIDVEPQRAGQGLDQIGALYRIEQRIRDQDLSAAPKRAYRQAHAKPLVEKFFAWIAEQFAWQGLLPSSPFTKALAYARERKDGLMVYLDDPDVAIDTNHLERALRPIPMGRRSWLFCWTEIGAKHVGVLQSLLSTCRLHEIDPYQYLVDVLQRIDQHPASQVEQLTPRLWKQHFADNPLRSNVSFR